MRPANRKLKKLYSEGRCKHIARNGSFVFYCKAEHQLGPDCSEGCSDFEPIKNRHFTNRECRMMIHIIHKSIKEFRKNSRRMRQFD